MGLVQVIPASYLERLQNPSHGEFGHALTFGAANSTRIDCGNPTILTDLTQVTCCAWIYNTSTSNLSRDIWGKGTNVRRMRISAVTNRFGIVVSRATTPLNAEGVCTNFPAYALNKWLFFCGQLDTGGANGDQKLYVGDQLSRPVEPSAYQTQSVGSGIVTSDSGGNFQIGNQASGTAWVGRLASVAIWNRLLSYAEILQQWELGLTNFGLLAPTAGCVNLVFPGFNGVGSQRDWSGHDNHGTVTGATYTPFGVPSPTAPAWHRRAFKAAAAPTGNPWYYYRGQRAA